MRLINNNCRLSQKLLTRAEKHGLSLSLIFFKRMKIQALILFLSLAVLLIETSSITQVIKTTCEISNKCSDKKKENKCSNKKDTDEKNAGKCSDKTTCVSCPVCCVFILQSQYEWPAKYFVFKQTYPVENTDIISSYSSFSWKPPDSYL